MSDPLAALRDELSLANRILANEGVLDAFGHVSVRHPSNPGRFLLSRHRAPALVARHARPGDRVLVVGAGKSGALVCAQARQTRAGEIVAADVSEDALRALSEMGVVDRALRVDATRGMETLGQVESTGGLFDLVVCCASVPGTEMSCILAARDGGTIIFFSMATSFTTVALGAEGVGKDATLLVGNGYVAGHADLALDLVRRNRKLRAHFEARYAR